MRPIQITEQCGNIKQALMIADENHRALWDVFQPLNSYLHTGEF